ALLDRAVGGGLVEALEGGEEAVVAGGRGLTLARQLDRGGDVAGLGQRVAQCLQLNQLVVTVVADGPLRGRVAVAALPTAQGVGAHPEDFGSGVGSDSGHLVIGGRRGGLRVYSTGEADSPTVYEAFGQIYGDLSAILQGADADRLPHGPRPPHRRVSLVQELLGVGAVLWTGDDAGRNGDPQPPRALELAELPQQPLAHLHRFHSPDVRRQHAERVLLEA